MAAPPSHPARSAVAAPVMPAVGVIIVESACSADGVIHRIEAPISPSDTPDIIRTRVIESGILRRDATISMRVQHHDGIWIVISDPHAHFSSAVPLRVWISSSAVGAQLSDEECSHPSVRAVVAAVGDLAISPHIAGPGDSFESIARVARESGAYRSASVSLDTIPGSAGSYERVLMFQGEYWIANRQLWDTYTCGPREGHARTSCTSGGGKLFIGYEAKLVGGRIEAVEGGMSLIFKEVPFQWVQGHVRPRQSGFGFEKTAEDPIVECQAHAAIMQAAFRRKWRPGHELGLAELVGVFASPNRWDRYGATTLAHLVIASNRALGGDLFDAVEQLSTWADNALKGCSFPGYKLESGRCFGLYRLRNLMQDCLASIAGLRNSGHCHRDISPENILLSVPLPDLAALRAAQATVSRFTIGSQASLKESSDPIVVSHLTALVDRAHSMQPDCQTAALHLAFGAHSPGDHSTSPDSFGAVTAAFESAANRKLEWPSADLSAFLGQEKKAADAVARHAAAAAIAHASAVVEALPTLYTKSNVPRAIVVTQLAMAAAIPACLGAVVSRLLPALGDPALNSQKQRMTTTEARLDSSLSSSSASGAASSSSSMAASASSSSSSGAASASSSSSMEASAVWAKVVDVAAEAVQGAVLEGIQGVLEHFGASDAESTAAEHSSRVVATLAREAFESAERVARLATKSRIAKPGDDATETRGSGFMGVEDAAASSLMRALVSLPQTEHPSISGMAVIGGVAAAAACEAHLRFRLVDLGMAHQITREAPGARIPQPTKLTPDGRIATVPLGKPVFAEQCERIGPSHTCLVDEYAIGMTCLYTISQGRHAGPKNPTDLQGLLLHGKYSESDWSRFASSGKVLEPLKSCLAQRAVQGEAAGPGWLVAALESKDGLFDIIQALTAPESHRVTVYAAQVHPSLLGTDPCGTPGTGGSCEQAHTAIDDVCAATMRLLGLARAARESGRAATGEDAVELASHALLAEGARMAGVVSCSSRATRLDRCRHAAQRCNHVLVAARDALLAHRTGLYTLSTDCDLDSELDMSKPEHAVYRVNRAASTAASVPPSS